ncbi:MAG: hypothetical protein Q9182_003298 [Xanthomendoza sp. 2 TL-2023]
MDPASGPYKFQLAHWDDNRSPQLIAVSVILILATCIIIALRFWAQCRIGKQWEADNVLIAFAAAFAIGDTIASIVAYSSGVGKHLVRVLESDPRKPRNLVRILEAAYAITLLQGFCLGLIKFSILLFYRRIFTMHRRTFQITFYFLGTYTILLTIATFLVYLLQCLPLGFFWEVAYIIAKVPPPHPVSGDCLPHQKDIAPTSIASTISDVALMLLPAIGLWKLSLPRAKKVGLFFVFSLGAFVTFVGVMRIYYGYKVTFEDDVPWVNADIMVWTAVECCVGTICASLPTLAPLLKPPPQQQSGSTESRAVKSWASRMREVRIEDDGTDLPALPLKGRKGMEISPGKTAERWGALGTV